MHILSFIIGIVQCDSLPGESTKENKLWWPFGSPMKSVMSDPFVTPAEAAAITAAKNDAVKKAAAKNAAASTANYSYYSRMFS